MTEQASPSDKPQTYAGLYMRLKAGLMDWTFCAFFASIIAIVMIINFESSPWIFPIGLSISLISTWLYFALYESSASGATPGKKRYQISVRDTNGNRITFIKASIRFVGKLVTLNTYLLLMIPIFFNQRRRALQDFIAGTVVVDNWKITNEDGQPEVIPSEKITIEQGLHLDTPLEEFTNVNNSAKTTPSKSIDSRGSGKEFLIGLVIFVMTCYVAYYFFGGDWKLPSKKIPYNFPVLVTLSGSGEPTFKNLGWYQLQSSLTEHPDWKLELPLGKNHLYLDSAGEEPEEVDFDVKPIAAGIRVEVTQRGGSYNIDATYTVFNNKVTPEEMHWWNAMSLMAAIIIAILTTSLALRGRKYLLLHHHKHSV
jgi:uncharacterized RDD family membrane protein YckC